MSNALNFNLEMTNPVNTTVGYSLFPTFLCPSDNIKARPASPWAPLNYAETWVARARSAHGPVSSSPAGNPWYNNSNNGGPVATESVTDGTSNTGMWSEHLIGINDPGTGYGNRVLRSDPTAVRAMFLVSIALTHDDPVNGVANALSFAQQCANIPASQQSLGTRNSADHWASAWPTRSRTTATATSTPRTTPGVPTPTVRTPRTGVAPCAAPRRRATTPAASTSASPTAR